MGAWAYHTFVLKHFSYYVYRQLLAEKMVSRNFLFKGRKMEIVDAESFLFMHQEIFLNGTYNFSAENGAPFILDCGANIGMSVIYFKELYPNSEILAFEPDPRIFEVLNRNMKSFDLNSVTILNNAVCSHDGVMAFYSQGSDAGRLKNAPEIADKINVDGVRLSKFIDRSIDFLKIDIEGAEYEVLEEIKEKLEFVKNIFIEYHSFVDQEFCLDKLLGILKNNGFGVYINAPGLTAPQPFIRRPNKHGMDMQLNIYAFKKIQKKCI